MNLYLTAALVGLLAILTPSVEAHGRLIEPPGRSTAWRYGFKTPPNYTDNELFCGGLIRQHKQNGGKCGVCGDPWDVRPPRPNEDGGSFGKKVIVRKYKSGQIIDAAVDITANHHGPFRFKLCPVHEGKTDQACFDRHPVDVVGSGKVWQLKSSNLGVHRLKLKLPNGLKCQRCVLQWDWTAANNWGICKDGKGRVGCGPQETFRGCADIAIV